MADNVNPEEALEPNPNIPDIASDSSSSDDGTSTKSTDVKTTTDDAATPDSELSTPAKESSESSSNKEDPSRKQSPRAGGSGLPPGAVLGQPQAGAGDLGSKVVSPDVAPDPKETDPLIKRRSAGEQVQGDEEEIEAIAPVPGQVIAVDPTRRSPNGRRFLSSLSERFEFSNEYIVFLLSKWQAFSLFASDSRYLVYFQLGLIAVSIANVCIGTVHFHNCPLSYWLPILLIVVGLSGIMAMTARMALVLYKFYTTNETYSKLLRKVVFAMNCIYLITLTWEFTDYMLSDSPLTDENDSNYCHPFFLSYIKGYNCTAFMIVFLSLILHGPAYLFYSWKIGGPGLPDS